MCDVFIIHPVKKPDKMKNISLLNKSHSFNAHIADFCRSCFTSAGSVETYGKCRWTHGCEFDIKQAGTSKMLSKSDGCHTFSIIVVSSTTKEWEIYFKYWQEDTYWIIACSYNVRLAEQHGHFWSSHIIFQRCSFLKQWDFWCQIQSLT